jgi:inosine/xanthosine triphosphatase
MIAIIGSLNPIKINAARNGLTIAFTDECRVIGVPLNGLQLPNQPMTMEDTLMGARRRAVHSVLAGDCDLGIGLEGGLAHIDDEWFCISWAAVANRDGEIKSAMGPCVYVPPPVMRLVESGMELGDADDQYFGLSNSKQSSGLVGTMTHDLVTREHGFTQAVIIALCSMSKQRSAI